MSRTCILLVSALVIASVHVHWSKGQLLDAETYRVLNAFEPGFKSYQGKSGLANWNYQTNISNYNQDKLLQARLDSSRFTNMMCTVVKALVGNSAITLSNFTIKRWADNIIPGCSVPPNPDRTIRINQLGSQMQGIYSTAKVSIDGTVMSLEPELTELLAKDMEFKKLLRGWRGWYNAATKGMKELYIEYVRLLNEVSKEEGYADRGKQWQAGFEHQPPTDFEKDLGKIWEDIKPMYQQLHAYVRHKMREIYKDYPEFFTSSGHMPHHILGNMWAQSWDNKFSKLVPFPNKPMVDITSAMLNQGYTVRKMFDRSDEFFRSLGLRAMPDLFWQNSMLQKPTDREVVCHASAWNLLNGDDVRVKMCTTINQKDFITVHHEMGHIQYYLQYNTLPVVFQGGANPGFHEAIGDTIALSVTTPKHLKKIQLLPDRFDENDYESNINSLMSTALSKIVFLPFGYLVDKWRWQVYDGRVSPSQYNDAWWDLVCKYQGLYPPVKRDMNGFDAGGKYHIPANSQYISYFISHILQFQFYKYMCGKAGHTGEIHKCDFYQSQAAGEKFNKMLTYGSSRLWQDQLFEFIEERSYNSAQIIEYFKPLTDWLTKFNRENNVTAGWDETKCPTAPNIDLPAEEVVPTTVAPSTDKPMTTSRQPQSTSAGPTQTVQPDEGPQWWVWVIVGVAALLIVIVIIAIIGAIFAKKKKRQVSDFELEPRKY